MNRRTIVLSPEDPLAAEIISRQVERGEKGAILVGQGNSMEPTLQPGDRIVFNKTRVRKGLVVAFRWNGFLKIHRIVRVLGDRFWARGDSGIVTEGPIVIGELVGVAEGYWRDGKYTSLGGWWQETGGLSSNIAMNHLRLWARRWPRLRREIEINILGSGLGRRLIAPLGRLWFGDIEVVVDDAVERVVGALVSERNPLTQKLVDDVEERVGRGDMRLLVARSRRKGRIGRLLLEMVSKGADLRVGYLHGFYVSFGARNMGVGSRLLRFAEDEGEKRGLSRLAALVDRDSIWKLKTFESAGFRVVGGDELDARPEAGRASVPAHQVLVEKELH